MESLIGTVLLDYLLSRRQHLAKSKIADQSDPLPPILWDRIHELYPASPRCPADSRNVCGDTVARIPCGSCAVT